MEYEWKDMLRYLKEQGLTLATAESLTGGLLSSRITDVPGSSAVFRGSVISYQSETKVRLLGVDRQMLETNGPASRPVARAMAQGVRTLLQADLALAVTGVAGPDPDAFGAPVGLVFVSLAGPDWCLCRQLQLSGSRHTIREDTCKAALKLLENTISANIRAE